MTTLSMHTPASWQSAIDQAERVVTDLLALADAPVTSPEQSDRLRLFAGRMVDEIAILRGGLAIAIHGSEGAAVRAARQTLERDALAEKAATLCHFTRRCEVRR